MRQKKLAQNEDARNEDARNEDAQANENVVQINQTAEDTSIPPPDAPANLSKYKRFVATDVVAIPSEDRGHTCVLGSPPKTAYIRTHPDKTCTESLHVMVHEVAGQKKTYLLDPVLLNDPDLEGLTKIIIVIPWITHHTSPKLGLWPVSIEQEGNPWIRSALNIIEVARSTWLKVIPSKQRMEYVTRPPAVVFPEPDWLKMPIGIEAWLDLTFRESDWLTQDNWSNHPIRKAIREGS